MKVINATLTLGMHEILRQSIGQMMYSFSVEDTGYNSCSENTFRNYLTSFVSLQHFDFVIFNEIKTEETVKGLFKKNNKDVYVSFSLVRDCEEPEKVDGIFDMAVDETVRGVKIVQDTYNIIRGNKVECKISSDIAIMIELDTKKILFQREEPWSDNLTIDVYKKDESELFYIPQTPTDLEDKKYKIEASRRIFSVTES